MASVRFDPSQAVTFDLARGQVHLEGAPARVLLPADALGELLGVAGEGAARKLGRALGAPLGDRVASRLGGSRGATEAVRHATLEEVLEHLGGEFALAGLGALSLERWGRAMVFAVEGSPMAGAGDALLAGVLEGALGAATGREVAVVPVEREGSRARLLVASEGAARKVRDLLASGARFAEAVARLHDGRGEA